MMSMLSIIAASRRRMDADALAYLTAVESADTQALEPEVRSAINSFVVGCKSDGVWDAIKASCILAGARTLTGCLVPLKGTAPTNVGPFVSGDYNRKTGLVGNGSSKYLNSNRANSADPQNNFSLGFWVSTAISTDGYYGGGNVLVAGVSAILKVGSNLRFHAKSTPQEISGVGGATGFIGHSRSSSTSYTFRNSGTSQTITTSTTGNNSQNIYIFARNGTSNVPLFFANGRQAFYFIGESLDLALLDSRLTTLMSDLNSAIP